MNSTNVSQNTNKESAVLNRELDELSKAGQAKLTRSAELKQRLAEQNRLARIAKDAIKAEYESDIIVADDERITAMELEVIERKAKLQERVNKSKFTGKLVNAVSFSG